MIVPAILFWFGVGWILYVLVGYPILMYLLARLRPRPIRRNSGNLPSICFVMAAYNEERLIGAKLENYLSLDYPRDRLRFLIGSDGSSDATDTIIQDYCARDGSIELTRYNRVGKTRIIYELAERVEEEIIIFTDADILLERNALREVAACFADPNVGGVIGMMVYTDPTRNAGNVGQQKYQQLEDWLRESEARFYTTVGPRGECHAARRGAFLPLFDSGLSDDTHLVISTPLLGYRVWYEPRVVFYETTRRSVSTEYRRRLRMGQLLAATVFAHPETRWPWRSLLGFQMWSHKILRNTLALPLLLVVVSGLLLGVLAGGVYAVAAWGVIAYLGALLLGALFDRMGWSARIVQYPLYFTAMFISLALGTVRAFSRGGMTTWSQERVGQP